jgi:phage terminase large subunit-like protein
MGTIHALEDFAERCELELEPFQRRILRAVSSGTREVAILLARGNGKTSLAALIALHHLVTVEDAKVVVAAASRDQATNLFAYADRYARALGDPHVIHRYLELRWYPDIGSAAKHGTYWSRSLTVLASDAPKLHGLTYSLAIVDELQAHGDEAVYVALASALHKRPGAQLVTISTAGQGTDSPLGQLRARALALPEVRRRGAVTDARGPGLRFLEWTLPDDADVSKPSVVKRVNPASWITAEAIAHARDGLPDLAFRRYVCNMWTERARHWLPPGAWQQCVTSPVIEAGETISVGVDVGGQRSATAVAWVTADLRAGVWIGNGDDAVLEAGEVIRELAATFVIREVTFDPWRAGQLAAELERERVLTTAFPQSDSRMIPASARLHAAVVEKRLQLPDLPELHAHAANTIARHSRRGWRLDRPDGRTPNDAIIALAMAVDAVENRPEPARVLGFV